MINHMKRTQSYCARTCLLLAAMIVASCKETTGPLNGTGVIEVRISTTGADADIDHSGYTIMLDHASLLRVGINETVTVGPVSRGRHVVQLEGVTANCSFDTKARVIDVIDDSSVVLFSVSCSAIDGWELAQN